MQALFLDFIDELAGLLGRAQDEDLLVEAVGVLANLRIPDVCSLPAPAGVLYMCAVIVSMSVCQSMCYEYQSCCFLSIDWEFLEKIIVCGLL